MIFGIIYLQVYANSEFLGDENLGSEERADLLADVRKGVRGMTDLIESLLLFSRTGESMQLSYESLPYVAERSLGIARARIRKCTASAWFWSPCRRLKHGWTC